MPGKVLDCPLMSRAALAEAMRGRAVLRYLGTAPTVTGREKVPMGVCQGHCRGVGPRPASADSCAHWERWDNSLEFQTAAVCVRVQPSAMCTLPARYLHRNDTHFLS